MIIANTIVGSAPSTVLVCMTKDDNLNAPYPYNVTTEVGSTKEHKPAASFDEAVKIYNMAITNGLNLYRGK